MQHGADGEAAERVTDALRPAYDDLCSQLPAQPVLKHLRDANQIGGEEVVAVDVRRVALSGLSRTTDARGDRAGRTADRLVYGRGRLVSVRCAKTRDA